MRQLFLALCLFFAAAAFAQPDSELVRESAHAHGLVVGRIYAMPKQVTLLPRDPLDIGRKGDGITSGTFQRDAKVSAGALARVLELRGGAKSAIYYVELTPSDASTSGTLGWLDGAEIDPLGLAPLPLPEITSVHVDRTPYPTPALLEDWKGGVLRGSGAVKNGAMSKYIPAGTQGGTVTRGSDSSGGGVWICTSKDAYAYHNDGECHLLNQCINGSIIRVSMSEARRRDRGDPCDHCAL